MRLSAKSILLMLVLFLFATNIAIIITYRNHLKGEELPVKPEIEVPETQLGKFFRAELNLNDDQHSQFRAFRQQYNRSANKILMDMQAIRNSMIKALDQTHPDRSELNSLADQLGEKHKELKKATFDYYFNLQNVLNAEQQDKMTTIFQSMLTDEGFAKTNSPANNGQGRQGQGQGRGHGQGQFNQHSDSIAP